MNVNNLRAASSLFEKLKILEDQYAMVIRGHALGVTIQSAYQDDDFVNAVRDSVSLELSRRIGRVKSQLVELGVVDFTPQ